MALYRGRPPELPAWFEVNGGRRILTTCTPDDLQAHAAATHEECQPDNKYDTTALEASYLAQGQANRAQEIRQGLEAYRE